MTTRDTPRLLRGGSWGFIPGGCRSACRDHGRPDDAFDIVGFRVICLPREVAPPRIMPLRGGSWAGRVGLYNPELRYWRSAYRAMGGPDEDGSNVGFRVVCLQATPQGFTWLP